MSTEVKILPHEEEQMFEFAIEGLVKGYSQTDLLSKLKESWMSAPEEALQKVIKRALKAIKEETLTDIEKIIPLHIEMYEEIYQLADEMRVVGLKVEAMRAKEKLVGLHRETNSIEIHNEVNVEIETEPQYDISKLTTQEQKRLEGLMKKIQR